MESGDDLTFDERDSAAFVPKCVVVDPNFDWQADLAPNGCTSLGRHDRLRDPCEGFHQAAS
jgi:pullulanase/glycogen debranching enzyme